MRIVGITIKYGVNDLCRNIFNVEARVLEFKLESSSIVTTEILDRPQYKTDDY